MEFKITLLFHCCSNGIPMNIPVIFSLLFQSWMVFHEKNVDFTTGIFFTVIPMKIPVA